MNNTQRLKFNKQSRIKMCALSVVLASAALSGCGGGSNNASRDEGNGATGLNNDVFLAFVNTVVDTSDDVSPAGSADVVSPTSPESNEMAPLT